MSRKLQDFLALASYKNRHGLDNLSFDRVEAHAISRIRTAAGGASSVVSSLSSSSSSASEIHAYSRGLQSSPILGPHYSDGLDYGDEASRSRKRARFREQYLGPTPSSSARKPRRRQKATRPSSKHQTWSSQHYLPQSSPLQDRFLQDFRTTEGPGFSFVSTASTIPNSPPLGPSSDSSTPSLPATFRGSPPRTPPPTRPRGLRNKLNGNSGNGEEGVDLLMYLATSPSPANATSKGISHMFPPSTPPSNHAALPSSMLNTPRGGGGLSLFTGFSTPGQPFNFGDFVNVTPSPAQGAFSRTPGTARTPLAAKEARRKLNFDNIGPPGGSPTAMRGGNAGLGMELGGELIT